MNEYLLDTITITRHFSQKGKIGSKARRIIERAEEAGTGKLFISTVSLFEIIYLHERARVSVSVENVISYLQSKRYYEVIDLSLPIIFVAQHISFYEMHNRLILATASYLGVPILSSDEKFDQVMDVQRIW
jgi:PIN domain nuclease of toxin-antitoxin system